MNDLMINLLAQYRTYNLKKKTTRNGQIMFGLRVALSKKNPLIDKFHNHTHQLDTLQRKYLPNFVRDPENIGISLEPRTSHLCIPLCKLDRIF